MRRAAHVGPSSMLRRARSDCGLQPTPKRTPVCARPAGLTGVAGRRHVVPARTRSGPAVSGPVMRHPADAPRGREQGLGRCAGVRRAVMSEDGEPGGAVTGAGVVNMQGAPVSQCEICFRHRVPSLMASAQAVRAGSALGGRPAGLQTLPVMPPAARPPGRSQGFGAKTVRAFWAAERCRCMGKKSPAVTLNASAWSSVTLVLASEVLPA
jgi:hypothetical protein